MTDIITVIGARPQFVKAAPVSRALRLAGLDEQIVHTGQHYDAQMSSVFFDELEIPRPQHSLEVGSGPHGRQTAAMLQAIEQVLEETRPRLVLVYGDTNSTLAAALAAVKLHVPVAHVEAGLRSFNRRMPEEINRVTCDHVSELLFAPTSVAVGHLAEEGITNGVHQVGDVMADATRLFAARATNTDEIRRRFRLAGEYSLATVHRAESTDNPDVLKAIMDALSAVAQRVPVVLPLHPRTASRIAEFGLTVDPALVTIEPVGYLDMLALERNAAVVITDSGGVQKEAFFQGVPCVTLRSETEWTELVDAGWNRLVDPKSSMELVEAVDAAIGSPGAPVQPYGDGHAADRIAALMAAHESAWFCS